MSALPQPKTDPRLARQRAKRTASERLRQHRSRRNPVFVARATEAATVLGINVVLIGGCLFTLSSMLPQQLTQQAKLREIRGEVSQTSEHVDQLKQSHDRSLIPEMSRRISEEQGYLIRKNKRNLVWLKPTDSKN